MSECFDADYVCINNCINAILQENEKLYLQMKAQQVRSKANEEAMFSENQRLLNELALSRYVYQSCLFKVNVNLFVTVNYVSKYIFLILFVYLYQGATT